MAKIEPSSTKPGELLLENKVGFHGFNFKIGTLVRNPCGLWERDIIQQYDTMIACYIPGITAAVKTSWILQHCSPTACPSSQCVRLLSVYRLLSQPVRIYFSRLCLQPLGAFLYSSILIAQQQSVSRQ